VLVGGDIVEVAWDVLVRKDVGAFVLVSVFVGTVAATVDGNNIPVSKRPVALIPMTSPMERYLISARMMDGIFVVVRNFCVFR
jgi:hypothetical protein